MVIKWVCTILAPEPLDLTQSRCDVDLKDLVEAVEMWCAYQPVDKKMGMPKGVMLYGQAALKRLIDDSGDSLANQSHADLLRVWAYLLPADSIDAARALVNKFHDKDGGDSGAASSSGHAKKKRQDCKEAV